MFLLFILLGIHWASWVFILMPFIKFEKFSAKYSLPLCLTLLLLEFPQWVCWFIWWFPTSPQTPFTFLHSFLFLRFNHYFPLFIFCCFILLPDLLSPRISFVIKGVSPWSPHLLWDIQTRILAMTIGKIFNLYSLNFITYKITKLNSSLWL